MEAAYKQAGRPMEDPLSGASFNRGRDGDYEAFKKSEVNKTAVAAQEAAKRIYIGIDAIRTQYDGISVVEQEYGKKLENLKAQEYALSQTAFAKEIDLERTFQDARLALKNEYEQKILDAKVGYIQKALEAEKSLINFTLGEKSKEVLQQAGAAERQKAIVAERIAFEKKSDVEKAAFAIDQGAQMFSALGAQNKKAFEAAKAFNIANAIMNTYMAATKALASYPPPFNFIAMAAAIGMGFAQVAQIRSQQYSGRALGGPVMGGTPYIVGESGPELFTPNTTGSITRNSDLGGGENVSVNFTINAVDTAGFDELLISRRGLITQVISDAMTEKGQRGL
jgi:hypothetical protein